MTLIAQPDLRCMARSTEIVRRLGAPARSAIGVVVLLLALLQALGPFLHAHARTSVGSGQGLHLHLVNAGQTTVAPVDADRHHVAALPMAAPDDGSAVFLTTEYRRDADLVPVLVPFATLALPVRPARADVGEGREALRWPAASSQAPPGDPAHRFPPATAPPSA